MPIQRVRPAPRPTIRAPAPPQQFNINPPPPPPPPRTRPPHFLPHHPQLPHPQPQPQTLAFLCCGFRKPRPTMSAHNPPHPRDLLSRNASWAARTATLHPNLFPTMSAGQSPSILWLGCSDSRVPETTVLDLQPGDVFVHRNIANVLPPSDLSSQAVLQYAVEVLHVKHVIVAGHYGCGGVNAALGDKRLGLIDAWLRNIREVRAKYERELQKLGGEERSDRLVELNVQEQVRSVRRNANVQEAIAERGLEVHGWVFDIATGRCKEIDCDVEEGEKGVFKLTA